MNKGSRYYEPVNDDHSPAGGGGSGSAPDLRDPDVFRAIWHRQQPHVYFLALRLLGDRQAAEDAATEAFIKLWKGSYTFPSEQAVAGWLRTTTRNGCLDLLKQRRSQQQRLQDMAGLLYDGEDQWSREDILAARLQALYTGIEALPPRGREIFKRRFLDGMKNEAIAELLGLSHQSVRDHLYRSLKTLRLSLRHRQDLLLLLLLLWQQPPLN
jgi:RNA polymerase sigma-70 factor (ECF subfamily)